jgi:hypothetical protein
VQRSNPVAITGLNLMRFTPTEPASAPCITARNMALSFKGAEGGVGDIGTQIGAAGAAARQPALRRDRPEGEGSVRGRMAQGRSK